MKNILKLVWIWTVIILLIVLFKTKNTPEDTTSTTKTNTNTTIQWNATETWVLSWSGEKSIMDWNPDEVKKDLKVKYNGTKEVKVDWTDAIATFIKSNKVKFENFNLNGVSSYMVDRNFTYSGSYVWEMKGLLENYVNKKEIPSIMLLVKDVMFEFTLDKEYKIIWIKNISNSTTIPNSPLIWKDVMELFK